MSKSGHSFLQSTLFPLLFVLVIWMVFYYDNHYVLNLHRFGVQPHALHGLIGIIAAPLLHGDLGHIISNTFPILVLGTLLFYYYPEIALRVFAVSGIAGGALIWIFGRTGSNHIGASGIIYALAGFLFFSGILRRNRMLFSVSLLVTFLYGTIVWGVFPPEFQKAFHIQIHEHISWEGHFFGFLSGVALAFIYRKVGLQEPSYSWEETNDDDIDESNPYWMVDQEQDTQEPKEDAFKNVSDNPYTVNYTFIPKKEEDKSD